MLTGLNSEHESHMRNKCLFDIELAIGYFIWLHFKLHGNATWKDTFDSSLILLNNYAASGLVCFLISQCIPGCGLLCLTNSQALSLSWIRVHGEETEIWAHKRLKFSLFDCFSCVVGLSTMGPARRVRFKLAIAGGREGALRGAAANPRILSRIPRMRLRSFAFPSVTMGSVGGWGKREDWGSLFLLSPHCEESFHSLGAQCLGFSVHWSESFLGGKLARQCRPLRIRPTGIIRISSQCPRRGS